MKKFIFFIAVAFLIVIAVAIGLKLLIPKGSWVCVNGEWVKEGNPIYGQPMAGCGETADGPAATATNTLIRVFGPKPRDTAGSPLTVTGEARGSWYFEASFPVKLIAPDGSILAQVPASAQSDWMTDEFVPFVAVLEFSIASATDATLVLEKDNPSGLPEYDAQITLLVRLEPSNRTSVKVFFNNNKLDPEISCNKVFPVERQIEPTEAVARAALTELLAGPTEAESGVGYFTSINPGVKLQSLAIDNGVARADFDLELGARVGGSCRVSAIRAEIEETLKQFPTVNEVIISINGRTEDILQP